MGSLSIPPLNVEVGSHSIHQLSAQGSRDGRPHTEQALRSDLSNIRALCGEGRTCRPPQDEHGSRHPWRRRRHTQGVSQ